MLKLFSKKITFLLVVVSLLCLSSFQAEAVRRNCREQFLYGEDDFSSIQMIACAEESKNLNKISLTVEDYYEVVGLKNPTSILSEGLLEATDPLQAFKGLTTSLVELFEATNLLQIFIGENESIPNTLKAKVSYLYNEIKAINNLISFQETELEGKNLIDQIEIMQRKIGLTNPIKGSLFRQVEQLRNQAESKIHFFTLVLSALQQTAEENR